MKLDTALYQLKNFPEDFLRNNLLSIAGHSPSEDCVYHFGYYGNFNRGPGTNEGFKFAYNQVMASSQKAGIDGKSTKALKVHNIRMIPNTEDLDISNIEPYVLDNAGPDLMITGQLSGCVFAIQRILSIPPCFVVAHIQPGGKRQTGHMLRETIRLMGRFRGYGRVTHVFGIGKDYQNRAHVVGIRRNNT